jgi:hypothetical protein
MKRSHLTVEQALACRAGLDLDLFVFEYIFDGLLDGLKTIPSFSKRADPAKMLLIKLAVDMSERGDKFMTSWSDANYGPAVKSGQISSDSSIPVWAVECGDLAGYGRTSEEALCKFAILTKRRYDNA